MGSDWDDFLADAIWAPPRKAKVEVGATAPAPPAPPVEVRRRFPTLCRLIAGARLTPVSIGGVPHMLFGWSKGRGESTGWLCRGPSSSSETAMLHDDHRMLASFSGGIVERWDEPEDTWLLNHNEVLTATLAREPLDLAPSVWANEGRPLPIDVDAWYTFAQEANGNLTICNRATGDVLLFAQDHSFDHVVPLEGSPDYTLYRINGAPTLVAWVERVAEQWLAAVSP